MQPLAIIGLCLIGYFSFSLFLFLIDYLINKFKLLHIRQVVIKGWVWPTNDRVYYSVYIKRFLRWKLIFSGFEDYADAERCARRQLKDQPFTVKVFNSFNQQ